MITLYRKDTQEPVDINESEAPAAIASGQFLVDGDTSFNLINAEGSTVGSVKGDKLHDALQRGLRIETGEESARRTSLADVRAKGAQADKEAFIAGAGRGLTLGLSDLALTKAGLVDQSYLEALRENSPGHSLAGELGGTGLGLALSGGTSGAGKLAIAGTRAGMETKAAFGLADALIPSAGLNTLGGAIGGRVEGFALKALTGSLEKSGASLAKRALARAAGLGVAGAVEGSVVGLGQAITEDSLGDPRDMGELLVASVGPSALLGGLAGGTFGAASALGGAALSKMAQRAEDTIAEVVGEQAPKIRQSQAFKALGLSDKQAEGAMSAKRMHAAVDTLLDPNILGDGEAIVRKGADTEEILERAKMAVSKYGQNREAIISGLDDLAERMDVAPPTTETGMVPAGAQVSGENILAGKVASPHLDPATDLPNKHAIAERIMEIAERDYAGKRPYKAAYREMKAAAEELARDETPFYSFRDAQGQKISYGSAFESFVKTGSKEDGWRKIYNVFKDEIENSAERMLTKIDAPEIFDLWKKSGEVYSALKDVTDAAGGKWAQAGDQFVGDMARKGKEFFKGLSWRMVYSGRGLASASRMSATAMGIRQAVGTVADFVKPSRIANLANDTAKLAQIQKRAESFSNSVDAAVDKLMNLKVHRVTAQPSVRILNDLTDVKDEQKAWRTYREEVLALSDPTKLANNVALSLGGLEQVAPNISYEAAATLTRAHQAIMEAMPKPFNAATLQPTLDEFEPLPDELSKFKRVVAAAMKPESILSDLRQGTLTPESVDTVAQVYPGFMEKLKSSIAAKLAAREEKIPYNLRYQLSVLFGLPTDPTFEEDFVKRSQLAWAPQGPGPDARGSPPKLDPDSTRKLFDKQSFETTSQRIAGGVG